MKTKHLFSLLSLSFLVFSCAMAEMRDIHISGTAPLDKERVYLVDPFANGWPRIDSADIVDGKFSLTSHQRSHRLFYITMNGYRQFHPFFNDGTPVVADMSRGLLSGSDALARFSLMDHKKDSIDAAFSSLTTSLSRDASMSPKQIKAAIHDATLKNQQEVSALYEPLFEKDDDARVYAIYYLFRFGGSLPTSRCKELLAEGTRARSNPILYDIVNTYLPIREFSESFVGKRFPEIDDIMAVDGRHIPLSQAVGTGKWTILDFWSMGCGPCHMFIRQSLSSFYRRFGTDRFHSVSIQIHDGQRGWESYQNTYKDAVWKNYWGNHCEETQQQIFDRYGKKGVPFILLIDPDGIVRFASFGDNPAFSRILSEHLSD